MMEAKDGLMYDMPFPRPEIWPVGSEDPLRAWRAEMRRSWGGLCVVRRVVVRDARCARGGVGGDEGEEDGCEGDKSEGFVQGREKGGAEAGEVQPDVVQVGDGCAIGFEGGGPPCNVNATGEGVPEQYVGNDGKDGEVNGRREGPSLDKIAVGLDNDHHHQNCAGDGTSSGDDGIPGKSTNY